MAKRVTPPALQRPHVDGGHFANFMQPGSCPLRLVDAAGDMPAMPKDDRSSSPLSLLRSPLLF
jgi:hypothetical protein